MTIQDWFKINPNHKVTLRPAPGGRVRAVLSGGDGVDQRLVGAGADEFQAMAHALEVRALILARVA